MPRERKEEKIYLHDGYTLKVKFLWQLTVVVVVGLLMSQFHIARPEKLQTKLKKQQQQLNLG